LLLKTLVLSGHFVEIVRGDITRQHTEAIVNAANGFLWHGGGVALAIARAAGPVLIDECNRYIRKHGQIATGEAVLTSGGNLNAGYVIHAVGPVSGSGDEDEKLRSAILHSLDICESHSIKSCAFPAISSGIFGFPKERCAEIFLETLQDYFLRHEDSVIQLIRLCNIDEPTSAVFLSAAETFQVK